MKQARRGPRLLLAAAMTPLLLGFGPVMSQQCTTSTSTRSSTAVFQSPPRFVTGAGWQGIQEDQLPSGTTVYICREHNVAFGFSTRTWVQIQYRVAGRQEWRNGWIPKETLVTLREPNSLPELLATIVAPANASELKPHTVATELPPPLDPAPNSQISSADVPWSTLAALYGPLFLALIVGILAKIGVDCLDDWHNLSLRKKALRGHVRNGLIAILVSPIVFLGFLNAGQFPAAKQTFMVLALLAFQNGFFWQTVLKKGDQTA